MSDARPLWLLGCGMKEALPLAGEVERLLLAEATVFNWEPGERKREVSLRKWEAYL